MVIDLRASLALLGFAMLGVSACSSSGPAAEAPPHDAAPDLTDAAAMELSTITHVAMDAMCPQGGSITQSGLDTNGNGVLDPDEVTSTTHACASIIEGSITIHNSLEAQALVGVTTITGSLTIDAQGLSSIDVTALATIGGSLDVSAFDGDFIAPSLASVGQGMYLYSGGVTAPVLTTLTSLWIKTRPGAVNSFGALVSLGTLVDQTAATTELLLPALQTADFMMLLSARTVRAPVLTTVVAIELSKGEALDMPALATIGTFTIDDNITGTTALMLPGLTSITTKLVVNYVGTATLSFPSLTLVGDLLIDNCTHVSLQAPALAHAGAIKMSGPVDDTGTLAWDPAALIEAHRISISHYGTFTTTLTFPHLQHLATHFALWSLPTLQALSFPALTDLGGSLLLYTLASDNPVDIQPGHLPLLASIAMPVLTHVGGNFGVTDLPALTSVSVPALATIDGALRVGESPAAAQYPLPALAHVGGALRVSDVRYTAFALPNLVTAGLLELSYSTTLTTVSLPKLTTVTTAVHITEVPALTTVEAPALVAFGSLFVAYAHALASLPLAHVVTVTGDIQFYDGALQTIDLSALTTLGGQLWIENAGPVSSVLAPKLTSATALLLSGGPLSTLSFTALATVAGDLTIYDPNVVTAALPALTSVGGNLTIRGDSQLQTVTAPNLTAVAGSLVMYSNPHLPSCSVQALAAQSHAASYNAFGDDTAATCP